MTYLVIAVLSLHLLALPLGFAVLLDVDSDKKMGKLKVLFYFLPIFVKKLDLDKILNKFTTRDAVGSERESDEEAETKEDKKSSPFKRKVIKFLIKVGVEAIKRLRVRDLDMDAVIGTGDAALTAYSVGSVGIAYAQACAYFDMPNEGIFKPNYDEVRLYMNFSGIFSLCLGDIIYAVCTVVLSNIKEYGRSRRKHEHGTYAR